MLMCDKGRNTADLPVIWRFFFSLPFDFGDSLSLWGISHLKYILHVSLKECI